MTVRALIGTTRPGRMDIFTSSRVTWWICVACITVCTLQSRVEGCQVICSDFCEVNPICDVLGGVTFCAPMYPLLDGTPPGEVVLNVTVNPVGSEIRLREEATIFDVRDTQVITNATIDRDQGTSSLSFTVDCREETSDPWSSGTDSIFFKFDVDDVNESPPAFTENDITASVREDATVGTKLETNVEILATDPDYTDGQNGIRYYIVDSDVPFSIIPDGTCSGAGAPVMIRLDEELDYDHGVQLYNITISAQDGCPVAAPWTEDILNTTVSVTIEVKNVDDQAPEFDQSQYVFDVNENDPTQTITVSAKDQDDFDTPVEYSLTEQTGLWACSDNFEINNDTGVISVVKELDYETSIGECNITVQATQTDNCEMFAEATVTVTVVDVDECPYFLEDLYPGQLSNDDPFVLILGMNDRLMVGASDGDLLFNGTFTAPSGVELVQVGSGNDQTQFYYVRYLEPSLVPDDDQIELLVFDPACSARSTNITVDLLTEGLAPNFTETTYYGDVQEDASEGTTIITVSAVNADGDDQGIEYRLQLVSDEGEALFELGRTSGVLTVATGVELDAEITTQYTMIVEAIDVRYTFFRSTFVTVIIDVGDVNEDSPYFINTPYNVSIEEELPIGFSVITVEADDPDVNSTLVYDIDDPDVPFEISTSTGEITISGRVNREDRGSEPFNLTVLVSDEDFEATTQVVIYLLDINDNPPEVMAEIFELQENETEAYFQINATDLDVGENAKLSYAIESSDPRFSIDNRETGIITVNGFFDYEEEKIVSLLVSVSDPEFITYATVDINIIDINDNAPEFTTKCPTVNVMENTVVGTTICTVVASDADEDGLAVVNYRLDDPSGKFDIAADGKVTILNDLDAEANQTLSFDIIASDEGPPPLSTPTPVIVTVGDENDNVPFFDDNEAVIYVLWEDLLNIPALLYSVTPSDADVTVANRFVLCQRLSGNDSFALHTTSDGICEVYTYEAITISPDPYIVNFYALNPDNPDELSDTFTLTIYVAADCYIAFEDKLNKDVNFDVTIEKNDLNDGIAIQTVSVMSNCNLDDVKFEIRKEEYQADMDTDPVESSTMHFNIADSTGDIAPIDVSIISLGKYSLEVFAKNESDPIVNDTTTVHIVVTDEVNTAPYFNATTYERTLTQDWQTDVMDLSAYVTDPERPQLGNGEVVFMEISEIDDDTGAETEYFTVSPEGLVTTSTEYLQRIIVGNFKLVVMVEDKAVEPLNGTAEISIHVNVIPEIVRAPSLTKSCGDEEVIEEESTSREICDIDATSSYDTAIIYNFDNSTDSRFHIETYTGVISTNDTFDYDAGDRSLLVLAYAEGVTSGLRTYTTITVLISDINDNPPVFSSYPLNFTMQEHHKDKPCETKRVGDIQTTDEDSLANSDVTYSTDNPDFEIVDSVLQTADCVNLEDYASGGAAFTITATNIRLGGETQTNSTEAFVVIEDINDNPPEFMSDDWNRVVYFSDLFPGNVLFQATAEDADKGPYNNDIAFSFSEVQDDVVVFLLFEISYTSGNVTVREGVIESDFELEEYSIKIVATDKGSPPLSSSENLVIRIFNNYTRNYPYFSNDQRENRLEIPVEEGNSSCEGFTAPQTCNPDATVNYTISPNPKSVEGDQYFYINTTLSSTTHYFCVRPGLDRERDGNEYSGDVTATYGSDYVCGESTSRRKRAVSGFDELEPNQFGFIVSVIDVNNKPPVLDDKPFALAAIDNMKFGTTVTTILATDPDEISDLHFNLTFASDTSDAVITIDELTGEVVTNSLLYTPYLDDAWKWTYPVDPTVTEFSYNVSVCDEECVCEETNPCDASELKFKILLSFEHIIIEIKAGIEDVQNQLDNYTSCVQSKTSSTVTMYLQFLSPTVGQEGSTDMWMYAVDPTRTTQSQYLTFADFADDVDCRTRTCDVTCAEVSTAATASMTAHRLDLSSVRSPPTYSSRLSGMGQLVPIVMACVILVGNIVCIIFLLMSWRRWLRESGRQISMSLKEGMAEDMGTTNPVFVPDIERGREADEDNSTTGSREPLITDVYVTDGKNITMLSLVEGNAPTNVDYAVGMAPLSPTRDYGSQEMIMDVYPFDEGDEDYSVDETIQITGGMIAFVPSAVPASPTPPSPTPSSSPRPSSPKLPSPEPSSSEPPELDIPEADYDVDDPNEIAGASPSDSSENQPMEQEPLVALSQAPPPMNKDYNAQPPAEFDVDDTKENDAASSSESSENQSADQTFFPTNYPPPPLPHAYNDPLPGEMPASSEETRSEPQVEPSTDELPPPPSSFMEVESSSGSKTNSLKDEAGAEEDAEADDVLEPMNYEYDVPKPPPFSAATAPQPVPLADIPPEVLDEAPSDLRTVTFGGETVVGLSRGYAGSTVTYDSEQDSVPTEIRYTPGYENVKIPQL